MYFVECKNQIIFLLWMNVSIDNFKCRRILCHFMEKSQFFFSSLFSPSFRICVDIIKWESLLQRLQKCNFYRIYVWSQMKVGKWQTMSWIGGVQMWWLRQRLLIANVDRFSPKQCVSFAFGCLSMLSLNRIIMFFYFCLSAITSVFCKSEQWIEFDTFQYIQSKNLSSMSMGSLWFWYSSGCYRRSFNAVHCQWKWHSINSYFKCIDRREEDMHRCLLMTFLKKCSLR